jgi:3-methyladenine DNA glycosylase AlkD
VRATLQQAYMKSSMPYAGVAMSDVRSIARDVLGELTFEGAADWMETAHPRQLRPALTEWSRSDDIWKRRTAIIAQLGFKDATDAALLFRWIEPSLESNEFFLRKAIGCALREYSRSAPDVVRRFVAEHGDALSPLSRREALRLIQRG